jgi:hypothetical protein
MSLKATIFHRVPASEIPNRVPREFRDFVNVSQLKGALYTVISYPGMRGESSSIVDSKVLAKALQKAQAKPEPIVAVAHSFTAEARSLLAEVNAIGFARHDAFHWTDESYARIRDAK